MAEKRKAVSYARELAVFIAGVPYEQKFSGFLQCCEYARKAGAEIVMVAYAEVLGDTYEELCQSLRLIAKHELTLAIASGDEIGEALPVGIADMEALDGKAQQHS